MPEIYTDANVPERQPLIPVNDAARQNVEKIKPALNKIEHVGSTLHSNSSSQAEATMHSHTFAHKIGEDIETHIFAATITGADRISNLLSKLIPNILRDIQKSVQKQIYFGWAKKESHIKRCALLEQKKQQVETLTNKIEKIQQAGGAPKKIESLLQRRENLLSSIDSIEEKIKKFNKLEKKGQETRALLKKLGAEPVKIVTRDQVQLDGNFVDANQFKSKLKNSGGQLATLTLEDQEGSQKQIQGFAFDRDSINEEHIIEHLHAFGSLCNDEEDNQTNLQEKAWTFVEHRDQIILLPTQTARQNLHDSFTFKEGQAFFSSSTTCTLQLQEIDTTQKSQGTVLLTSGNAGLYEMHKSDVMYFLMQGMNVMLFNFRGYGQSEGTPTGKGLKKDIDAAYQYLRSKDIPEDKICAKGLCMGGGPAAYIAAKYPETHLFLDQTYSNFQELIAEQVHKKVTQYLAPFKEHPHIADQINAWFAKNLKSLCRAVSRLMTADFNTKLNIAKNKGQKAILYSYGDELIAQHHVVSNMQKLAKKNELDRLMVRGVPGEHGQNWITAFEMTASSTKEGIEAQQQYIDAIHQANKGYSDAKETLNENEAEIQQKGKWDQKQKKIDRTYNERITRTKIQYISFLIQYQYLQGTNPKAKESAKVAQKNLSQIEENIKNSTAEIKKLQIEKKELEKEIQQIEQMQQIQQRLPQDHIASWQQQLIEQEIKEKLEQNIEEKSTELHRLKMMISISEMEIDANQEKITEQMQFLQTNPLFNVGVGVEFMDRFLSAANLKQPLLAS